MIKDKVGKRMAPLEAFLQLTCPKMGIIAVSDYLEMLNWDVTYGNGVLSITRIDGPDLGALDPAIVSCSMTHIDLLQYALDSGYLDEVDTFTHDVHHSSTHMLVSAATKFPGQAKAAFTTAIQKDPKGIAAFIFGIDANNKFLEISTSSSGLPLDTVENPFLSNIMPMPVAAPMPLLQPVTQMVAEYPWTGNMSELYKPSEMALDFEAMMADNEWMVTDITSPLDMDHYLETVGGYDPNELYAGRKFMQAL
jgi:hypothetical protein